MKRRSMLIAILVVVLTAVFLAPYAWRRFDSWAAGIHHHMITKELAAWEDAYRIVRTWSGAKQAARMMGYVRRYYVPAPGYRSDESTEAKLKAQRSRTVQAIATALKDFTGQDFGEDEKRWLEWIENHGGGDSSEAARKAESAQAQ